MNPKQDRIAIPDALKRIACTYEIEPREAKEIFRQVARSGSTALIERCEGRYLEVEYSDVIERFQGYGQNEDDAWQSILDDGVVYNLTGPNATTLRVRPVRWFVDWNNLNRQLGDFELAEDRIVVLPGQVGKSADGGCLKAQAWLKKNWRVRDRKKQAKSSCKTDATKEIPGLKPTAFKNAWTKVSRTHPEWGMQKAGSKGDGKGGGK